MVHEAAVEAVFTAVELAADIAAAEAVWSRHVTTSLISGVVTGLVSGTALSNTKHATLLGGASGAAAPYFLGNGKANAGEMVLSGVVSTMVGYVSNQLVHHSKDKQTAKNHTDRETERRIPHGNRQITAMLEAQNEPAR